MPVFGVGQAGPNSAPGLNITGVFPGDGPYYLFNAENPGAAAPSVVFERGQSPTMDDAGITFLIEWAAAATDSLLILGSNSPNLSVFNLADWATLYTSSNKQTDQYTDIARYKYYCAYLSTYGAGQPLTVTAMR